MSKNKSTVTTRVMTHETLTAPFLHQMASLIEAWHPYTWPASILGSSAAVVQLRTDVIVGYVWFTPVASTDLRVIEMHAAVDPEYHNRWLRPKVAWDILAVIEAYADVCLALHPSPKLRRVLSRFGWKAYGDIVNVLHVRDIPWDSLHPSSRQPLRRHQHRR